MDGWFISAGNWARTVFNIGTMWRRALRVGSPWTKRISNWLLFDMDKILIAAIDCVAAIGVTSEERTIRQRLSIDVEIATDTTRAAQADSLKEALDYSKVATQV